MKSFFSLLLALISLLAALAENNPTFHVAPAPIGNDSGNGSAQAPFATIARAQLAVRDQLQKTPQTSDIVVEIRAGTYSLSAPIIFDPTDSGRNGFSIVYRAATQAQVIVSGGRAVPDWKKIDARTYQTSVGRDVDFRQLWVGNQRAIRAREPNAGATFKFESEKQENGFDLPLDRANAFLLHSNEVEFSVLIAWMHKRLRISGITENPDGKTARAVIAPGEWDGVTAQPQGNRTYVKRSYWLENAREFLDSPGEFFLNRRAGELLYQPRKGEDLSRIKIVRPELENLIVLQGALDNPVHHLRFEGIIFAHTGWTRPNRSGFVDVQANSLVPANIARAVDRQYRHDQRKDRIPAAFQAHTADHIVIRHCRFMQLGGTGVMFTGGGNDNVIEGNSFSDLAAGGIEIGEDAARPNNPRVFPRRNRIANNFITRIGQDYLGSVAILGYYTDSSLIAHNEIDDIPYTAISQGWGWGNPTGPDEARGNRITHNRVTNFMRQLDDGGGIYTTDRQLESEISHNVVARMLQPDAHSDAGGGIYPDQFTEGYTIHHNVVSESIRWLFIWNPNIRHNRVEKNFADTAAWRNDGKDNVVEPAMLHTREKPLPEAEAIITEAGLEPAFAKVREIPALP
ncbi:right-handed parallel beta-helix repeat-containing protein [Oleiharenicola lentus]|uniref:right-handed parallel beta-helix repeat-containing protein n=1 Tax=Oleiharenicola lentus TaxID=2508720 RepID=UPI003F661903